MQKNRPDIKLTISKWELLLIVIHLVVISSEISYYVLYWNSIPEIILTNSHRGKNQDKDGYAHQSVIGSFMLMATSIFFSFYLPKYGYLRGWKGRNLSRDLIKAEQQYRVERSNLLCISVVVHLLLFLHRVIGIEKQVKFNIPGDTLMTFPQAVILVITSWLIHHIVWTRLADKS